MSKITKWLIFTFTMAISFTGIVLWANLTDHTVSSTLITCFYGLLTAPEIISCFGIKAINVLKTRQEPDEEEEEGAVG